MLEVGIIVFGGIEVVSGSIHFIENRSYEFVPLII